VRRDSGTSSTGACSSVYIVMATEAGVRRSYTRKAALARRPTWREPRLGVLAFMMRAFARRRAPTSCRAVA